MTKTPKPRKSGMAAASKEAPRLTLKQELFCQAYIECDGNASEAYRKAYDASEMKPETINKRASELVQNGAIAGRIEELRHDMVLRHQVTIDRVIAEYAKLAFANMQDYMRIDGEGLPCIDLSAINSAQSAAISEITCEIVRTERDGDKHLPILKAKIKLADKKAALDSISRTLGIFVDKHELTGKDGAPLVPVLNVMYGDGRSSQPVPAS